MFPGGIVTPFVIVICVMFLFVMAMMVVDHMDKRIKHNAEKAALRAENAQLKQRLARYEGDEDPANIKAGCTD
jgi:uncharacterized membrane protein